MAQEAEAVHSSEVDGKLVVVQGVVDGAGRRGVRLRVFTGAELMCEKLDRFVPITLSMEEARQVAVGIVKVLK